MGGCAGFKPAFLALSVLSSLSLLLPSPSAAVGLGRNHGLAFQKSVVNQGDERLLHNVFAKLQRGECLEVIAVGGSVTCGVSLPNNGQLFPDAVQSNRTKAWPAFVQMLLNTHYPCPGGHHVVNVCVGGAGSDTWVDYFSGRDRFAPRQDGDGNGLSGKDLVVMDTAMNDVNELGRNMRRSGMDITLAIQKMTEALMVLFLHNMSSAGSAAGGSGSRSGSARIYQDLPSEISSAHTWAWSGIACIWLGTSTRGDAPVWDGSWPRTGDSVHTHLPIAQHHGVPYVSMPDGFGPFHTQESQQWFLNVYRGDRCCHVSVHGHLLLAELLLDFLQTRFEDWTLRDLNRPWPYGSSDRSAAYALRQPRLLSSWEVLQLTGSSPLRMDMQGAYPHQPLNSTTAPCVGFNFSDDGHNKPGLIAYERGSTCSFLVSNSDLQLHATFWQLHIKTLKSYDLMGRLDVQVTAVDCNVTEGITHAEPLGSMLVDCLWEKHFSLSFVDRMDLKRPSDPKACMLIALTVVPGTNATFNKIKVFDMELF